MSNSWATIHTSKAKPRACNACIIVVIEVQRSATKLINSIKQLTYENRLKTYPKYRRARGDMIKVFKILHGYYNNINDISHLPHIDVATRGNIYKLYQNSIKHDLRTHFSLT